MGCGQSKIHLYPRKNKNKANGKKSGHVDIDADADDDDGHNEERELRDSQNEKEKIEDGNLSDGSSPEPPNANDVIIPILKKNGPLLQNQEISSSQQNFFRMLDQKIEEGPDYDSSSETEMALEEARLNALVQHWESASLTASMCSSTSRSLQNTPVRQVPLRQQQIRSQYQQPLSAELLSQQQQMIKQLQQHQAQQAQQQQQQQQSSPQTIVMNNSPKRTEITGNHRQQLLSQQVIHQSYGVTNAPAQPPTHHMIAQYQQQSLVTNLQQQLQTSQLRQLSSSSVIPSTQSPVAGSGRNLPTPAQCLQMSYYSQTNPGNPTQPYFGEVMHPLQGQQIQQINAQQSPIQQPIPSAQSTLEPSCRFPPAIAVQRLAPQVQRQLRETQELIKDSCSQLYGSGYTGAGPPALRTQPRQTVRRPTLETQYSQELS